MVQPRRFINPSPSTDIASLESSSNNSDFEEVSAFPHRTEPFKVAAYAPLARAPFPADVVIFRGNVRQIMLLAEAATAAHVRAFKLATTTETRNTCTYCSVACGIIMYSRGDLSAGEKAELIHIEGDADHPTNRGTLCPKGAALKSYVKAATRLTRPRIRRPGAGEGPRPAGRRARGSWCQWWLW